jgi:hypothetical protein
VGETGLGVAGSTTGETDEPDRESAGTDGTGVVCTTGDEIGGVGRAPVNLE